MRRFLERNLPPGFTYKTELFVAAAALCSSVLLSVVRFFYILSQDIQNLYIRRGFDVILDESRVMPDFVIILGDKLNLTLVFAIFIFLWAAVSHYLYYRMGSKSIYLMRRLPNRWEIHRRSLLLPFIMSLIFALTAGTLLLLYYAVYMSFTPEVCLTPDQWQKIWSVFR